MSCGIDQDRLHEISDLFLEAEKAIKDIEDFGGELIVPAVNQLRYTGNHLVRYLNDPSGDGDELDSAAKHCKRAAYDAYEAAIIYHMLEFKKFKDDYRRVVVSDVIPNYSEICRRIEEARTFIRAHNKRKTRGENYRTGAEHLRHISTCMQRLNGGRDDLNKLIRRERKTTITLLLTGISAAAAIFGAVFQFLSKYP